MSSFKWAPDTVVMDEVDNETEEVLRTSQNIGEEDTKQHPLQMVEEGVDEYMQLQSDDENLEYMQDGEQNEPDNPIQEDEDGGIIVVEEDNIVSEEESMVGKKSVSILYLMDKRK